jgi:hypothetical protein
MLITCCAAAPRAAVAYLHAAGFSSSLTHARAARNRRCRRLALLASGPPTGKTLTDALTHRASGVSSVSCGVLVCMHDAHTPAIPASAASASFSHDGRSLARVGLVAFGGRPPGPCAVARRARITDGALSFRADTRCGWGREAWPQCLATTGDSHAQRRRQAYSSVRRSGQPAPS